MSQKSAEFSIEKFLGYQEQMRANLDAHPDAVGLVFLGSAADTSRADEWSDHDFFVISKDGQAEGMRQDLKWLPNFDQIALAVRETAHGLKVIYEDGLVLEFAVFEDSELEIAAANAFAVALDKCNLQQRMTAIAAKSVGRAPEFKQEFELFLCQLLIGVGRARRGEQLIAGQHLRSWAINNLLGLVRLHLAPAAETESKQDNLNRYRRFEQQYPALGERIELAQQKPLEACARDLLHIAIEVCGEALGERELHQIFVVRDRLGWI